MSTKFFSFILLFVLTLEAQERIVSLTPSLTEVVFALDKGKELVATSSYSLYPKEAQNLPIIGNHSTPNLEKIISLSPSLVIGQSFNQNTLDKLKKFHIKTLQLNLKTLKDIKNSITLLAKSINSNKADTLINDINNAIKNAPKSKKPHSVMIVYGLKEDLRNATYIAGHNIFIEDIILTCQNTNAYTDNYNSQPVLSYENIIAINPEQIIILHSQATESNVDVKKALKSWYSLPTKASKSGNISIVDEDYLHIPSHRVAKTITRLCTEMSKYND